MKCDKCQFENPKDSKYCNECGAKLELTCQKCNQVNPPGSKFCNQCGFTLSSAKQTPEFDYSQPNSYTPGYLAEKIFTTRSSIEGERKQVTILFCDIANSTSLAERLGAEAYHGVVDGFFDLCLAEVHRYEGTINQFLGDGFMALFGAPIACEDHARRAVLTAVKIQKEIKGNFQDDQRSDETPLELRMGLNTGFVVVGTIGDNLRMDYTAVGDTTNIAARLQQKADPGQILISGSTSNVVRDYCKTQKIGELRLKGKTKKIPAWEVISVGESLTRFEVEAQKGLTNFVGRSSELNILHENFAQVISGNGQVVSLVGESGIGKSRLLLEFKRQLNYKEAKWLEGHALSYGKSMSFHPLIDLLKRNFQIEENDPEDKVVGKIHHGLLKIGDDLLRTLPFQRYLLTSNSGDEAVQQMAPQMRRSEIFRSLRLLLLRAAELRPQILVFEDLHWFDQATEEALLFLVNSVQNSRVLVICTYRPEYTNRIGDRTYHTRIVLKSISNKDSLNMARSMLATDHLPESLQTMIVQKAEGNPLFVEEIVRSLLEFGVIRQEGNLYECVRDCDESFVPTSIQDVLSARIDRLEENRKQTLQIASVIGREFSYRLLKNLSDTTGSIEGILQDLVNIELLQVKQIFPEMVYIFKHALTQEVAYRSLLKVRRKHLHGQIGLSIEEIYKDRLAEFYEVLAYHFKMGEEWGKALEYLRKGGEKASQAYAIRDAIALYDQALEAVGRLGDELSPQTVMEIYKTKSDLLYIISEFKEARIQAEYVLKLAQQSGNRLMEGIARAMMAWSSTYAHDFDQALEDVEQVIEIGQKEQNNLLMARGHIIKGHAYIVTGRIFKAKPEIDRVLAINQSLKDDVVQANLLRVTGLVKNWEGNYLDGSEDLLESIKIAKQNNLSMLMIQSYFAYGVSLTGKGDYDNALSIFREGLELSEKMDEKAYHSRLLNGIGWLFCECGDLNNALKYNQQSAELGRTRDDPEIIANAELNLADTYLVQEELSRAHQHLDMVYRIVDDPSTSSWMKWRYAMHLYSSYGEFWLAMKNYSKAEQFAHKCISHAKETASRKYLVKGFRLMGEINLARGELGASEIWLRKAVLSARALGNPTQIYKAYFAMGQLQEKSRNSERAYNAFNSARQSIINVKESLYDSNLLRNFEKLPLVAKVIDASQQT